MKTLIWIWAFFSLLLGVVTAIDLKISKIVDADAQDDGVTNRWASIVTFRDEDKDKLHDWGQLTGLASEAYNEMVRDQKGNNEDVHKVPYTMTAISVGNKVYFSSTIKGGAFVYKTQEGNDISNEIVGKINIALTRCVTEQHPRHRLGAACGEILATQMYFVDVKGQPLNDKNARAVTWGKFYDDGNFDSKDVGVLNPCAAEAGNGFGCGRFLRDPEINVEGLYDQNAKASDVTVQTTDTKQGCLA